MKFVVEVLPKPEVLDSQGRAVEELLKKQGFAIQSCRVGKHLEFDMDQSDEKEALKCLHEMSEYVLYNPLIEQIKIRKI